MAREQGYQQIEEREPILTPHPTAASSSPSSSSALSTKQKWLVVYAPVLLLLFVLPSIVFRNDDFGSNQKILREQPDQVPPTTNTLRHVVHDQLRYSASYNTLMRPTADSNLLQFCDERFFEQQLDHFQPGGPTYQQRFFVCSQDTFQQNTGVVFFYVGNEADVELYLNNTGLMWENAQEFGAMLVFAEHRYFGKSIPFHGDELTKNMQYLSSEQALADYAVLIEHLKETMKIDVPVIGFGGSYGGMLGSWFRMKYPHILDGVIAASAPILHFLGDERPVDMEGFARVATFDASFEAGSGKYCQSNVRRVWQRMQVLGQTAEGRELVGHSLSLCKPDELASPEDVASLMEWLKGAFTEMAMGNYPYPSSYMLNGKSSLPAYPVRVACSYLGDDLSQADDEVLLSAIAKAVGLYYNSTGSSSCYEMNTAPNEESKEVDDLWGYLYCAEMYMPTSVNGFDDMFVPSPWNMSAENENCKQQWGVELRPEWAVTEFGGFKALLSASNIVFSNGNYDPWSATGVLSTISDSVVAVSIPGGAHHLDLFFSNEMDPVSVRSARNVEKLHMRKWIQQFYENKQLRERAGGGIP